MFLSKTKIFAVLLGSLLFGAMLFSCSQKKAEKPSEKTAAPAPVILKDGVDDTYPPMEYKDDRNETVGFDIDFAKEIAQRLNRKLEIVSTAWDGIFSSLKTDKFNCIISSVSITTERQNEYALTKPYIANAQVIVVGVKNNNITKAEDLKGKRVGCQVNTTAHESAKKYLEKMKFKLTTYDQIIQPFSDLKTKRLDAVIVDEVVAKYYVKNDSASYKVTGARLTNEPIGICFKKENGALRDSVNTIIDAMRADGTLKTISEKWFGEDLVTNVDEKLK